MKTQNEGYEFVKYGIVDKKHETDGYYIYSPYLEKLVCLKDNNSYFKQLHLIYRKK